MKPLPCILAKTEFPTMHAEQKRIIGGITLSVGISPQQARIMLEQAGAAIQIALAQTAKYLQFLLGSLNLWFSLGGPTITILTVAHTLPVMNFVLGKVLKIFLMSNCQEQESCLPANSLY
jgi:hypothetical protein